MMFVFSLCCRSVMDLCFSLVLRLSVSFLVVVCMFLVFSVLRLLGSLSLMVIILVRVEESYFVFVFCVRLCSERMVICGFWFLVSVGLRLLVKVLLCCSLERSSSVDNRMNVLMFVVVI